MTEWQPIETAPKDGSIVRVRRLYEGRIVKEGRAVYAMLAPDAPARQSVGPDPLNRLSAADYAAEDRARAAYVERPRWLNEDRLYAFPEPTHWMPPDNEPREKVA